MSVDEALEVGQQCGPAVVQVIPSDPDHGPAVGREDAVAELVAITCLAAAVVGVTVELDDQTAPRPDEVAFETGAGSGDEVVGKWRRQGGGVEQIEEQCFELAARRTDAADGPQQNRAQAPNPTPARIALEQVRQ
ncbi:MAG: hypothetical protein WBF18_13115 [Solirubrobacterales bacterium]